MIAAETNPQPIDPFAYDSPHGENGDTRIEPDAVASAQPETLPFLSGNPFEETGEDGLDPMETQRLAPKITQGKMARVHN
jgi:hypothetical protein